MSAIPSEAYDTPKSATASELDFLRDLGQHCASGYRGDIRTHHTPRLELLTNYLLGMERRSEWGRIDEAKVRAVVIELIADETKHRAAFVPTNGHGLIGSRRYARPVRRHGGGD